MTVLRWLPRTHPNIYKVPVGGMAVIGAVLAEGSQPSPVFECDALDRYGLEELGQGLILGEIGLKGKRFVIGRFRQGPQDGMGVLQDRQRRSLVLDEGSTVQRSGCVR